MGKSSQNKPEKIKKEKFFSKHLGLKYFLITFGGCLVVFGIVATIFILSILPPSLTAKVSSSNVSSSIIQASSKVSDKDTFNMFIVNVDDSVNKPVQMAIFRLDETSNEMAITIVPLELLSATNSNTTLSDVFTNQGLAALTTTVTKITRIKMNYTCLIKCSDLQNLVKMLNSVSFNVPYDISFTDTKNAVTTVTKGNRNLTGDQVRAIISSTSYIGGNAQRYKVQGDLLKAFIKAKLSGNYLDNANSIFKNVFPLMKTDLQFNDFLNKIGTFKKVSSQSTDYITIVSPDITPIIKGNSSVFVYGTNASQKFYENFDAK
jgi:anionic cell wall polymer biosynthesis LytR-Cps2A-Psr (LCP) family protein